MGYKTFTSGSVLTASDVNSYLMNQAVVTATSTTRPSSPPEGMVVYETDTDALVVYDGSTWVRLAAVASAAVQTWTPAVTQSGSVTVTVTEARYVRTGAVVEAWCQLAVTGSGSAGSSVTVTLPVTASGHTAGTPLGVGTITDASASDQWSVTVQQQTTTTVAFIADDSTGIGGFGSQPSVGLANGDTVRFHVRYTV